ncbi:MAG: TRAP transporter substrate-binding protein [Firmicutes bacterium]|nr:TRAP transporter substrate-binding protein [Bacillota bacterium]
MKKHVFTVLGVLLIVGLLALTGLSLTTSMRQGPKTLTYAEVNPLDGTICGEMAKAFKEKAEELSGGQLIIDVQAGGVLGSEDQILDNLLGGGNVCDITRISAFALTQYGCEKASLLGIPYTFTGEEHFWNFASSDLAQEFLLEPHNNGLPIRGLCYGEEGFRHFFFKDKVSGIEDLKNKKLRVSSDPIMTGMVGDLGASATTVAFTELYSALSTGVVDGAEQPAPNYLSNAFPEVAPYLMLDGHTLGAMQIVMSDVSWEGLTEQEREWVMEAAAYASEVCKGKVAEIEAQTYKTLEEQGVTIVEVEDKTPWIEACQPTIQSIASKQPELYQQILDMK